MDKRIGKIKNVRQFLLAQIADLSIDQVNTIPQAYSNNIVWNIAHLICAQQSLCYLRAGQSVIVDQKYITNYMTNTKPDGFVAEAELAEIKRLFISTIDQLQLDIEANLFANYTPSPFVANLYGVNLESIDDALEFLLYHEGFHAGYIIALKHLV